MIMEKTLKIIKDKWKAKVKGYRNRIRILNVAFQGLPHRDKENDYNNQDKEIGDNNKRITRYLS